MSSSISKVLLCDDHYISLLGIETLLRTHFSQDIHIQKATTGNEALELFQKNRPDLMIVDLGLPDISGAEVIKKIRMTNSECFIFIMTGTDSAHLLSQVMQLPVHGVLRKENSSHNLIEALNLLKIKNESMYVDPSVEGILNTSQDLSLTRREYEVLEYMTQGHTSQQIADALQCSITTIKTYRARIMNKSGARNSSEIIAWFLKGNVKRNFGSEP